MGLKWIMSLGLMGATTLFAQEREANIPADPQTGKPSTSAIAEDPHLTMNFEGVPLQSVLEYMSEAADLIILGETKVEGKVNILSKQPLNREEAVELLIVVLNENGYAAIRRGERMLKIVGKDKALIEDLPVRSGANPEDIPKNDLMVTQIIPIRFGNAGQLIENITELLPDYATISANAGSNAIILTDTQQNIHRIAEIVSALDTSISSISEIRVFPLVFRAVHPDRAGHRVGAGPAVPLSPRGCGQDLGAEVAAVEAAGVVAVPPVAAAAAAAPRWQRRPGWLPSPKKEQTPSWSVLQATLSPP